MGGAAAYTTKSVGGAQASGPSEPSRCEGLCNQSRRLALRERLRLRVRLEVSVAVLVGLIAAGLREGLAKGFAERVVVYVLWHRG